MGLIMDKHSLSISSFKDNVIFFCKAVFLFGLVLFFCFGVVMPQYSNGHNASLIDKVERLESIDGPKIVLIGNSNLTFGVDSERLEKTFHMPVVNMGLHGGLGNVFHENMAKLNVCEGDIYVICHSSFSDDGTISDKPLTWSTIENHYELWKILRFQDLYPMVKEYPVYLKKCLELYVNRTGNSISGGVYSRDAFNIYGDVALERDSSKYTFEDLVNPPPINDITINRINELDKWMTERGAVLLVAGYPIGKGALTAPEEEFVKRQQELSECLTCSVISDYRDYMFEYSLFYNTDLHLTSQGAVLRTQQLIEDLKKWMYKNSEK